MSNRLHYQESAAEAKDVIHRLLDADIDAFDPRADLERLMPNRCPGCGGTNVSEADDEGLIDCLDCGIWFDPLHPANSPNVPGNYPDPALWKERPPRHESLDDEIPDIKGYIMQHGRPSRITISFNKTNDESVERGDYSDSGWVDEEGVSMEPDKFDKEEGKTAVDLAVEFLWKEGATEFSSSDFDPDGWYTSGWEQNYRTGEEVENNYHLEDFTETQTKAIYDGIQAKIRERRARMDASINRPRP